ncbi:DUF2812 domain-containing protein [Chryseomicrobium sp. FSL W7-1435]|uniref:DUF2812 domain-containing protein n=1 Tax=Chryseomicrobium sp. FSL W7-1435 TaxID=2921704 RepID=UPI003159A836
MKKAFRPFWSYQIGTTEEWLHNQAMEGWQLKTINFVTRQFTFEQCEPAPTVYRIVKDKKVQQSLPRLEKEGWEQRVAKRDWSILAAEEPKLFPVRDKLFNRNSLHFQILGAVLFFYLLTSQLVINAITYPAPFFGEESQTIPILLLIVNVLALIWVVKLQFEQADFQKKEMGSEEFIAVSTGETVFKFRVGWIYDLQRTKDWLEELAEQGLVIKSVWPIGFMFEQKNPHRRAYECEFNYSVNSAYFSAYKEMGWQLHHTSTLGYFGYTIWSQPYDVQDTKPAITYVYQERLKRFRRTYHFHIGMILLLLAVPVFGLSPDIFTIPNEEHNTLPLSHGVLQILTVSWVLLLVKVVKSYFQFRRNLKEEFE